MKRETTLLSSPLFVVIFLLVFIGCDPGVDAKPPESSDEVEVTTKVTPEKSGEVHPAPGLYEVGDEIVIRAEPDEGWVFDTWEGSLKGSSNPDTITITGDLEIAALFEAAPSYEIEVEYEERFVAGEPANVPFRLNAVDGADASGDAEVAGRAVTVKTIAHHGYHERTVWTDDSGRASFYTYFRPDTTKTTLEFQVEDYHPQKVPIETYQRITISESVAQLRDLTIDWQNSNSDVIGYEIKRAGFFGDYETMSTMDTDAVTELEATYVDDSVIAGKRYRYRIDAIFEDGFVLEGNHHNTHAGLRKPLNTESRNFLLDPERNRIYVTVRRSDQDESPASRIDVLNMETLEVERQVPIDTEEGGPAGLALSADGQTLYVAVMHGGKVAFVDLETLNVTTVDVSEALNHKRVTNLAVLSPGNLIASAPDRAGSTWGSPHLAHIDIDEGKSVRRVTAPGVPRHDSFMRSANLASISESEDHLFAGHRCCTSELARIDVSQDTVSIVDSRNEFQPTHIGDILPANRALYLGNGTAVDPQDLSDIGTFVPGRLALSVDERRLYSIPSRRVRVAPYITVYDAETISEVRRVPTGVEDGFDVALGPNEEIAYVTDLRFDSLWAIPLD